MIGQTGASMSTEFAGGRVSVRVGVLPATDARVVVVTFPAAESPLTTGEARRLARLLHEHAASAERPAVDAWPDA